MIQTTKISEQYVLTADATEFAFNIPFFNDEDVRVFILDPSGNQTELTLGSINDGFSVTPVNGDTKLGATITTTETYGVDYTVIIIRELDVTQLIDFKRGGDIPAESLNEGLDRATCIAQQVLSTGADNVITLPLSDPDGLNYECPPVGTRADKALAFDSSGNVTVISLVDSGSIAVDTTKGLEINSNVIAGKTDGSTIGFDVNGQFELLDDAVDTQHIIDNAVTEDKIIDDAITTDKIVDGSVTDDKLDEVDGERLFNDSVPAEKLEAGIVDAVIFAGNKDLDTIIESGKYVGYEGDILWSNFPASSDAGNTAYIEVTNNGDSAYLEQQYNDAITSGRFTRYRTNNVWSAWVAVVPRTNLNYDYMTAASSGSQSTWVDTGNDLTITPTSIDNEIEVEWFADIQGYVGGVEYVSTLGARILRDGIVIGTITKSPPAASTSTYESQFHFYIIDEPNTVSEVTYSLQYRLAPTGGGAGSTMNLWAYGVQKLKELKLDA